MNTYLFKEITKLISVFTFSVFCVSCSTSDSKISGIIYGSEVYSAEFDTVKCIVSMLCKRNQSAGCDYKYISMSPNLSLLCKGKKYVLILDTSKQKINQFPFILKFDNRYNELMLWTNTAKFEYAFYLDIDGKINKRDTTLDIKPSLFRYTNDNLVRGRFIQAILSDSNLLLDPSFVPFVQDWEKQNIHMYTEENSIYRKLAKHGYDVEKQMCTFEPPLNGVKNSLSPVCNKFEIANQFINSSSIRDFSELYIKNQFYKLKYPGDMYINEYTISPGDSISFEGRISNDTIYAFQ